jgi:asparagine synthase (glutamine-hydrolysing)
MCGICGIVPGDPRAPVSESLLVAMRDTLVHRGPDDAGTFVAPGVGLGARRLAILDPSDRGHMPMATPDGRFWITYNGEIYNFRALRTQLESRGTTFRSEGDTEVLLALYAAQGPDMLALLNGMFAFAIWDRIERTLFMARDRLGVKPLDYAVHGDTLYFASEAKALFAAGVPKAFDPSALDELMCFRYVAGERSPYLDVRHLLPGHSLTWRAGRVRTTRWWRLSDRARSLGARPPSDAARWFRETFDDAVSARRISDVPVGVLLSGGLDSGSVAASLAGASSSAVESFTVRFAEAGFDEGRAARDVAARWALSPHELTVDPDHLPALLERAAALGDEPLAHASDLHLLAIATYAKPRVTVLLSGEGGDETLGGYVRYQPLGHLRALNGVQPLLRGAASLGRAGRRLQKLSRLLALGDRDRVLFNACDVLPQDLSALGRLEARGFAYRERVLHEAVALYPGEPARQASYLDQHTYLQSLLHRNDRMTMGASIECRVPFLDYRLVEGLAALPTSVLMRGRGSKPLLRQAIGDRLPPSVLRARKWGFGVPWATYLRRVPALGEIVRSLPQSEPFHSAGCSPASLGAIVDAFMAGDASRNAIVTGLVMIAVWYRATFETGSRRVPVGAPRPSFAVRALVARASG